MVVSQYSLVDEASLDYLMGDLCDAGKRGAYGQLTISSTLAPHGDRSQVVAFRATSVLCRRVCRSTRDWTSRTCSCCMLTRSLSFAYYMVQANHLDVEKVVPRWS